jgi:hypothetical protein
MMPKAKTRLTELDSRGGLAAMIDVDKQEEQVTH